MSQASQPGKYYRLRGLRFERQIDGRWGVSDGMLGVSNCRTPVSAYFALRRARKQGLPPVPDHVIGH